jgi:large subunit ribosomal protein L21
MYAVIETGGKQYRVQVGDIIAIEKVTSEKQALDVGSSLKINQVLFVSKPGDAAQVWVGKPFLNGASVEAEVVGQGRGEKVFIVKMKRRKGYRRTQGHRQELTQVIVTSLDNGAGEKSTLSAGDKKAKLDGFITSLTPKGPAFSPKQLGSKKTAKAAGETAKAEKPAKKAEKTS